jgi:lysophospholipase
VAAAIRSSRRLKDERYLKAISVPVYIVQCMEDRMVSNRAQDLLSSRINRSQLFHINGAKHEILRERDELRDQFWEIFDHYFELRS